MSKSNMKAWTVPTIHSIEKMKNATSGSGTGFAKGPTVTEYDYNGPGS